jgi:putative transposase
MDMTSVWVAEHGWCYLNTIIDCCTREIVGWNLSLRCRAQEAITVVEHAVREQGITPGTLTLGTDNGSAYTARRFRQVLSGLGSFTAAADIATLRARRLSSPGSRS